MGKSAKERMDENELWVEGIAKPGVRNVKVAIPREGGKWQILKRFNSVSTN